MQTKEILRVSVQKDKASQGNGGMSNDLSSDMSKRARILFTCIVILRLIEQGEYAAAIARRLNKSRQTVTSYIHRLVRDGYAEPLCQEGQRSYPVFYRLTEKGIALLQEMSKETRTARLRCHHYALKYLIVRDNPEFLPLRRGTQLKNNVIQVDGKVEGFSVRRISGRSEQWVLLYSQARFGDRPLDLVAFSSIELDHLASEISRRYDMSLQFQGIMQKPHFGDPSDRFARFWGQNYGSNIQTRDGSTIDASPGEWEKELTIDDAIAYLEQPRNVAEISRKQDEDRELFLQRLEILEKGNVTLNQRIDRLTDAVIMNTTTATAVMKSMDRLLHLKREKTHKNDGRR
jgi:DNA-binding MarR family transcriptional regulator